MDDRFERFSFSIFEISRCWHKIAAEEMERHGLKGPYAIYLTAMSRYPEGITSTRLGEICGRDKGDVSRSVALLETKGLLVREGNHYRALLKLTDAGKITAKAVSNRAELAMEHAGKGYTPEQRENFYQVLETVTQNLSALCKQGLPEN